MTFKPLLAATVKGPLQDLTFPLMWSPKLDGIRTLVVPGIGPVTRKIKIVPNDQIQIAMSDPDLHGLDGEIVFGPVTDPDVFNRTQSAVMTMAGPAFEEADGKYLVFDDFTNPELPFQERFESARRRVEALKDKYPFLKLVPHAVVENDLDLSNIERIVVEKGYEGVMVRSLDGRYKFGRSTERERILAKIKRFVDAEAEIIGFIEMNRNENELQRDALGNAKRSKVKEGLVAAGTLGALQVRSKEYGEFEIGSGFTAELKQYIWDHQDEFLGKIACFKFQSSGMKDKPRFPVYKGLRND